MRRCQALVWRIVTKIRARGHARARCDRDEIAAFLVGIGDEVAAVGRLERLDVLLGGVKPTDGGMVDGEVESGEERGKINSVIMR